MPHAVPAPQLSAPRSDFASVLARLPRAVLAQLHVLLRFVSVAVRGLPWRGALSRPPSLLRFDFSDALGQRPHVVPARPLAVRRSCSVAVVSPPLRVYACVRALLVQCAASSFSA